MKKIFVIISVLFAVGAMTSCVKPYENEISLALNNYDLTLDKIPAANKLGLNGECFHYIQVTATGPWELTVQPQNKGEIWCWLHDCYYVPQKDESGNNIMDENGYYLYNEVKVAEGVETFEGSSKFCTVRGNAGVTFVPMEYTENKGSLRYATVYVRRTDTGEMRVMNVVQKS